MTPQQTALYWREWAACSKALKALGHNGDDDQRKSLQRSALGERTISSKHLTNPQFTLVLAKFRSFSQPDDLAAQMHAQEEPEQRRADTLAKIEQLARDTGINGGLNGVSTYFKKWLGGIPIERQGDDTLRKLVGIMQARKRQLATPAPRKTRDPF